MLGRKCEIEFSGVKENVQIIVRNGYSEQAEIIEPDLNGIYLLKKGVYSYDVFGDGLCAVHKVFTITRKMLGKKHQITAPVIPFSGKESEYGGPVFLFSDELEEQLYHTNNLNEIDETIFDTPAFSPEKEINQFTTNEEKKEYLREQLKDCPHARLEEQAYLFPVVFFVKGCNLSELSISEIYTKIHENGKLNLFYHAQLHGIETPAGEGALTIAKKLAGAYGNEILDKMNIILIPCVNQKGNALVRRDKDGIDLNRDFLRVSTSEIQELHRIYYRMMPEVVIDGHTWTRANLFKNDNLKRTLFDVRISAANSLNMDKTLAEIDEDMAIYAQDACRNAGFRTGYYGASVNRSHSKTYYSLSPCCTIIFESEGTRTAKYHFKRNVWAQHKGITSIIDYVYQNCDRIKGSVETVRRQIQNSIYPNDGVFVVKQKRSGMKKYTSYIDNYNFFGKCVKKRDKVCHFQFDIPIKTLKVPKAFLIRTEDIDEKWITYFEEIHGVKCEKKTLEQEVNVQSIEKDKTIEMNAGTEVYWFPTNQWQVQVMIAVFVEDYREFEVKTEDGIYALYE